eukprot:gene5359-6502_t
MAVDAMDSVMKNKEEGNALFKASEFLKAAAAYTKAIKACPKDKAEDEQMAPIYSNRSAAFLKLNKVKQALADAETCVKIRPEWEKAHFRKGCALELGGDIPGAIAALEIAKAKDPSNKEIRTKLKVLTQKEKGQSGFQFAKSDPKPKAEEPKKAAPIRASAGITPGDVKWISEAADLNRPAVSRMDSVNSIGDAPWFFEEPDMVKMLDAGLAESMLGVITHSVCFIIDLEQKAGDNPELMAPAQAAADLAGAATGVMHNLLHPVLAAWKTRTQQMSLMGAIMKVLAAPGSPLLAEAGAEIKPSEELSGFLKLIAQIFGNADAFAMLTGHASVMRARMLMLRAMATMGMDGKDKAEWALKAKQASQVFVVLDKCRQAKGWEAVFDRLCSEEGVKEFCSEVDRVVEQHEMLVGAFKKFKFEGSLGL